MTKVAVFFIALVSVLFSCKSKQAGLEEGLYAKVFTDKGEILMKLHFEDTPLTVANFVSLAEGTSTIVADSLAGRKFYDGLPFHRVISNFMIQGGDIQRNGMGDPGYKFADEFPRDDAGELLFTHSKKGILSMANSGPNTNGSQFFITHKETPWLDGKHTVFGEVVKGFPVLDSIQQGDLIDKIRIERVGKVANAYKATKVFVESLDALKKEAVLKKQDQVKDSMAFSMKMNESKATLLKSGLKILTLQKGNGKQPKPGDKVSVHYTGYFADGKVFDSSYKRNQTFDFIVAVDRVIKGWTEGVQQINEGGEARLFIPYQLAYGERAYGPIPAKATLLFDVKVVKIKK
jgi:peptidyl-prolyl cis-trans isomerase A (cyclophilin A)